MSGEPVLAVGVLFGDPDHVSVVLVDRQDLFAGQQALAVVEPTDANFALGIDDFTRGGETRRPSRLKLSQPGS